jgi:hypothetical protein
MMRVRKFVVTLLMALVFITACTPMTPLDEKSEVVPSGTSTKAIALTETPFDLTFPTDTPVPSRTPAPPTPTEEPSINWDQARAFIGETKTVCGPVRSAFYSETSEGQPTFINIGKDYPDLRRFSVIIWGEDRVNFSAAPEKAYLDLTICVTGEIQEYDGIAEIFVESPSQITASDE